MMKRIAAVSWGALVAVALVGSPAGARAAEEHGGHAGHAMSQPAGAEKPGLFIRHAMVDGYMFMYYLLSWEERDKIMKGMTGPGMDTTGKATNDLMLYITGPDGKDVVDAKVGYHVVGPDKAEQKTLTMAMWGAYGADLNLRGKGDYTVKTKAVVGKKTLVEDFTYTVK
jgi:hypothetical protein